MKVNGTIEQKRPYPSPNPHVRLTEVLYWSCGYRVKGLLAEPLFEGNHEGILYLRGGIQNVGMVRPARIAQFAAQGFVVFAPYYRGNRGGEGRDEFAGEDRYDAVYGVDVLKQFLRVHRIHLFAFSRGGIMALWAAILRDDITSTVTWSGVSDIILTYEERNDMRRMMKRVIGGSPNTAPDAYDDRQPFAHIKDITCSLLIIHGKKDVNVGIEHARRLEEALVKEEKVFETWYFSEYDHFFPSEINKQIINDLTLWMKQQGGASS